MKTPRWIGLGILALVLGTPLFAANPPDPRAWLERETFWDNRDWDWYHANIPYFECPQSDLQTTYYYRWELLTKHLTYGSPKSGYSFTEFIDRPFWSGTYGAISCPAGHQLYEARWLRDPRYARDYARYWFRTPGAQPRNYSTWLADAVWALHRVHPDDAFVIDLLPDLRANHAAWEKRHFVPEIGLFWQTGHDDGMEFNINSRQTRDILRGAPGYRPTLNSYLWADALAIACVAERAGQPAVAADYRARAARIKENLQTRLWDPKRRFFFPMAQRDEDADGYRVRALTLTHQSGRFAGSEYGRELIGYVPWQFGLPDPGRGYEAAWKVLFDPDGFAAPFGPTTVERRDPMFLLKKTCCWWSGMSWPYATSQTLKALAVLLQNYEQHVVTPDQYVSLLTTFAKTHRKNGRPYLAEACHPETGSWEGHDGYNHSEHYFHSSFNDLVITGLVGLQPRDDNRLDIKPLAPADWPYFALVDVPYRGFRVGIFWDRDGSRYGQGPGLRLMVDGQTVAKSDRLGPLAADLPVRSATPARPADPINFAVNNDGTYFPRMTASFTGQGTLAKLQDGNSWYHRDPPNRWTAVGSPNPADWVAVDFGMPRRVHTVQLDFLDDGTGIRPPAQVELQTWNGRDWQTLEGVTASPERPTGHRSNRFRFTERDISRLRVVLRHAPESWAGLSEFAVWGHSPQPIPDPPPPAGNLAYNPGNQPFPRASASFADRFGGTPERAIDGVTNFLPNPINRWTSYGSPRESDWLELDLGQPVEFRRLELAIYDDRGGVQAPQRYAVQFWDGQDWRDVAQPRATPEKPRGGQWNEIRFAPVTARKLRIVFTHAGKARSGVSELLLWND